MIAWAVDTLIATSVLMLLVLIVRRPVAEQFGAGWAYALWLLPLLRIFMPPLDLFGGDLALPQRTVIYIPAAVETAAPLAASSGSGQWLPLLLALWAGGAAVFISWQQAAYGALMLSLGREGRRGDPPEYGGIRVVASESVDGPMAVGFLQRRIVVPLDFATRYSPAEQRLALEHELVHHRRGDIWWNLAALVLLTVNWFNPLAYFAFRAFRTDQELACDAAVAGRINADGRHDYACALVKSASWPGQIAACPLNRADQLKRRLKMMNRHRPSLARRLGGALAVFGLIGAGLVLAGPGFAQQERPAPPRLLVAERGDNSPIISDSEIATLREKCGDSSVTVKSDTPRGRTMVCGNGRVVEDPEVRRIVGRALERAQAEVVRAEVQAVKAEEIAWAVAEARTAVRHIEVEKPIAAAREALAQVRQTNLNAQLGEASKALAYARVQMAHVDTKAFRAIAVARAVPTVRIKMKNVGMSAEEHAQLQRELAEMREELRREQEEIHREAEHDREEALREAEQERREAVREAQQAREEALRDAAHARRDALREAEQARREAQQAIREAEQARREAEQERREAEAEHRRALRESRVGG